MFCELEPIGSEVKALERMRQQREASGNSATDTKRRCKDPF